MNDDQKGFIHLYYGNGKGKTTAALGLALRAVGSGMGVAVAQFLKDGTSSECALLERLPGVILLSGKAAPCFAFAMTPEQKQATTLLHNQHLDRLKEIMNNGDAEMILLDEAVDALTLGLLEPGKLLSLLDSRPPRTEIVITGHSAPEELVARADYVTEMKLQKHPYQLGFPARRGIEF